jgi:hypothetical protein
VAVSYLFGPQTLLLAIGISAAYQAFRVWYDEHRELRQLKRPVDPRVGLTSQATSLAVLIYVYGIPRGDVPGDHRGAVRYRFGMTAPLLLERVDRLLREASRIRDEPGEDRRGEIMRQLTLEYDVLSAEAARALAAWADSHRPPNPPAGQARDL